MANLPEALDAMLRNRYLPRELKSPVSTRRGLIARVNALGRVLGSDSAVAAALGVKPRQIQRWRDKKAVPSARSRRRLEGQYNRLITLPTFRRRIKALPVPNSVQVTADVKWAGYYNPKERRTVTLGGMRPVLQRVITAWVRAGAEVAADLFQRGAATVHNVANSDDEPGILFEGSDVVISIPWENP